MLNQDQISGTAVEVKGSAKEAVGTATGDAKLKADGKSDRIKGKARHAIGRFRERVNATFGGRKS